MQLSANAEKRQNRKHFWNMYKTFFLGTTFEQKRCEMFAERYTKTMESLPPLGYHSSCVRLLPSVLQACHWRIDSVQRIRL